MAKKKISEPPNKKERIHSVLRLEFILASVCSFQQLYVAIYINLLPASTAFTNAHDYFKFALKNWITFCS